MTVADVDALLYLPGHAKPDLTRALRIPALSEGWQGSFRDLLAQAAPGGTTTQPAWSGMRPMRVAAIDRESTAVISVTLVPSDGEAAVPAQPGQFLTLRLHPDPAAAPLLRTYSLSGMPSSDSYRVSVKREPHGAASEYLHDRLRVGDVIEVGAPRGLVRAACGRSSGGADQRRGWCDSGAGDASRARQRGLFATSVVGPQRAEQCRARVQGGGAAVARASSPTRTTSFATASPVRAMRGSTTAGGSRTKCSSRRAFRSTPTSISADQHGSWTTSPRP